MSETRFLPPSNLPKHGRWVAGLGRTAPALHAPACGVVGCGLARTAFEDLAPYPESRGKAGPESGPDSVLTPTSERMAVPLEVHKPLCLLKSFYQRFLAP